MKTPTFYETIFSLTKQLPNDAELGNALRKLIRKLDDEDKLKKANNPNQITIFQDIENYGTRS
jgi:hypothetical protein